MKIFKNYSIKNSLNIRSKAKYYVELYDKKDFNSFHLFVKKEKIPILIIGEATNIVLPDFYNGIIVKPIFNQFIFNEDQKTVAVGSSINWHEFVLKMIENNIIGYENLSSIPGSVGASPIQNIGAYGREVSDLIESVDCYDYINDEFITFKNIDCNFSYRNSIFKNKNYIIYNIDFTTNSYNNFNLKYSTVQKFIDSNKIDLNTINAMDVSKIITKIRSKTLPDPIKIPNVGSFFKNCIVNKNIINTDRFSLDELIIWNADNEKSKIGSARLIDLIKDQLDNFENVEIYEHHSLVLIAKDNATQEDIIDFARHIIDKVYENFNISLEIEPSIIFN